jgi:hypothetical protein
MGIIEIIDDWYIEVESNPNNYTIKRGNREKDKKGRCRDKVYGYYSTLPSAIKALRGEIITDTFSIGFRTFPEAFRTIREIYSRFEKCIERISK